jgi:sedoheptulokinase
MHFIGIDIGTSTISSVMYDAASEKSDSVTVENKASLASLKPWEKLQDPVVIIRQVEELLENFLYHCPSVGGIGITGQMHGILYVDGKGKAVSPLYTWQDGRGNLSFSNGLTYASYLTEKTGYPLATGFGLVTHFYNRKNGIVPPAAKYICTIMDYVVMRLTGETIPLTDHSNGASLGFFDVERLRFDYEALRKAGIDAAILPKLSGTPGSCGRYRNIPVYPAIGDNQAAFLGSVRNVRETIHVTVGTSSQLSVFSENYVKASALDTRPFPGGGYLLVGAALCGGQAFALLRTFFEETLRLFCQTPPGSEEIYSLMTSVLYKGSSADLPLVTPLFSGTRNHPVKRATIENLSASNLTPENLIIAFLKGISRELYDFYDTLPSGLKQGKNCIVGSGNALKKNPLLCRAFEEQFSHRFTLAPYPEEAAFGACLSSIASRIS